jgi:hypothetical protein
LLRLPRSGLSSSPRVIPPNSSAIEHHQPKSHSASISPTHPLKTNPTRAAKPPIVNLLKSLIVFGIQGIVHDLANVPVALTNTGGRFTKSTIHQSLGLVTFFIVQPLALAAEAVFKIYYRSWRARHWAKTSPPAWFESVERGVAFLAVWVWLSWSAGWFVDTMGRLGVFEPTLDLEFT